MAAGSNPVQPIPTIQYLQTEQSRSVRIYREPKPVTWGSDSNMATKKQPAQDLVQHRLVPEHIKISDEEKKTLFEKYNITLRELPKIYKTDPAITHLDAKENDIIKIIRNSSTAGKSVFYRGVINE